jgi:membrane fusion protein
MSSGLIRREVVEARSRRLEGAVILGAPLRSWVLTAFLSGVVLAAITMAAGTEYTRVTTVRGVLVPTSALVNIVAPRAGVVSNVAVEDAAFVQLHVPLVSIEVQRDSEIGRTPAAQSIAAIERQDSTIRERLKLELSRALTERQRLAAGLAGARAEHAQLLRQVDLQKKVIESAQAEYDRLAKVVSDGIVSKRDYERSLQSLLQEEERL